MIKKITIISFIVLLCSVYYQAISYGSSVPPDAHTNAPGENNCTQGSGCHGGTLITSGSNHGNLNLTSNFTGNGYIPDSVYVIKLSMSQSGVARWGFETTVLDGSNNMAGTLSTASGSGISWSSALVSSKTREYIKHSSAASASSSVSWTFTWKAPRTNVGPVKFYVALNAANADASSSGDQIYAKIFTINPSNLLPVADATNPNSLICQGSTVTLNGSSTNNATSWSWTFIQGAPNPATSGLQNPSVRWNNTGSNFLAILVSKNAKGSSLPDTVKINVKARPTINSVTPNTAQTLCKGDSVKFTANSSAANKFLWSPTGSTFNFTWAKDTGSYFVTVTNSDNCSVSSAPVKVSHHPSHTINLTRDVTNDTVCFEHPVKITASGSTVFDSIVYLTSFGKYQTTAINPQTFNFSASTDMFARGKDSKGCLTPLSNKFNFVVKTALSAPVASCIDKTTASFEINWSAVANSLGYQVSLDSGKTWQTPSSGNNGLTHKVLGFPSNTDIEVQLRAIDVFPCNYSPVTKVVCGSIPCSPLTYDIVWDTAACNGNNINFRIKNLNTNFYSLSIDNGNPFKDTVFVITADFSRTYKFELTDSSNLSCPTVKREAKVNVWEIPSLVFASNSSQNIFCEGSPAIFSVTAKGLQEYNFFLNNISKQKSSASVWTYPTPKNLDSVWVTVTHGACQSTTGKIKLGVKSLPSAKFTHSFNGRTATFTANETGIAKFKWSFGDGNSDTSGKNPVHKYAGSGTSNVWVRLTVIDEFGCINTDSMEIQIPASVKNTFRDHGIKVYPQPAKNSLKIEVPAEMTDAQLILTDINGKIITKTTANKKVTEIVTADLPGGVYILTVNKGNDQYTGKVIINR